MEVASNPIEDLIQAVEIVRAQVGAQPDRIHVASWVAPTMDAHAARAERRERKALRRGLSTRHGQRRRQRAEGVAAVRHERRRLAVWRLTRTIPETLEMADALRVRRSAAASAAEAP